MPFDYSKLAGRIVEVFKTREAFAREMQLSARSLSHKMNGKVPWKQPEIYKACILLKISDLEIKQYFFELKVQNV